jgi:hypothetical protein
MCCCVSNLLRNRAGAAVEKKKQCYNSPSHEPNVHSFVVFCLRVGKPTGSHHHRLVSRFNALWGLPLSFFFLFRHKYFWWPVISVWKSFAWKSISISRDMWNKKEMRNRILLSSGHPFPKSRLRRIGSIPFSFFFKFLRKRIKDGRVYYMLLQILWYKSICVYLSHTKFRIKAKILILFLYGRHAPHHRF